MGRGRAKVENERMSLHRRTQALTEAVARSRAARIEPVETAPPAPSAARISAVVRSAAKPEAPSADAKACNRRSRRKSTALPAMITFSNMRLTVPCTVADMSGSGARISLPAATAQTFGDMEHLPERITLVLKADRMQVDCQIMWRRAGKLGVRFLGPPRPTEPPRR